MTIEDVWAGKYLGQRALCAHVFKTILKKKMARTYKCAQAFGPKNLKWTLIVYPL